MPKAVNVQTTHETHEPAKFPNCENELINASATARFDGGRARMLDVQAKKQMKPEYDCAIMNLITAKCPSNRTLRQDTYRAT
jgi:hypothetical protein